MADIRDLKDGVYERVLSEGFTKKLEAALAEKEIWAKREDVDAQDAVGYLSSYLEKLVRISLKEIADRNEDNRMEREVELVNSLVTKLVGAIEELGDGHGVVRDQFLLKSLEHRANKIKERTWERPATSLTRSFLFTNSKKDASMITELTKEIASADRIDMLMSFIRYSGLLLLLPALRKFTERGGELRVATTTYMGATEAKAILALAQLPHTTVRISYDVKETRLHAKSYMFYRESGYSTAYVGSSNLSRAAIADGMEWNMKVTEQDMPNIVEKMRATFETYWHSEDFETFDAARDEEKLRRALDTQNGKTERGNDVTYSFDIQPYPYQAAILDALRTERLAKNRWHNLVVAATGTGKTAISAFDYRSFAAGRKEGTKLLFIAHREEILKQSRDCFRQVMKDPNFGELAVGENRASHPEHLFMSIQTFNSQKFWEKMAPSYYDMIIVDEFHHAAARSYQKLLSHFQPKILLGLTATPERMDGADILKYFDGHIAAEIRLPDAIERRLLCPFHYFGVSDPISLKDIKWTKGQYDIGELEHVYTAEGALAKQRARLIAEALERYTADLRDVKALGFCVSKKHAHYMADYFNDCGIPALALDADSQKSERDAAKQRLESGDIKIIFVVDLFNEGVDIPSVNTVLFLRPTNSMTVFLQQLGRGLRLSKGKDCLTVLDLVAQASRKYNFSSRFTALSGDPSIRVKQEIESGFPHVPKGCAIQLEEQAQNNILENIKSQLQGIKFYKECVLEIADVLGRAPTVSEFFDMSGIDPYTFYSKDKKKKRSYTRLLAEAGLIPNFPETEEEEALRGAFPRLLAIDSPKWISFMKRFYKKDSLLMSRVEEKYLDMWAITLFPNSPLSEKKNIREGVFVKEILELLDYRESKLDIIPCEPALPYACGLEVYSNYSRNQILAALGFADPNSIREGVKFLYEGNSDVVTTPTDVFMVTLNKSEKEFSDTTLYEDYSIDKHLFHWQSQSTIRPESKTGQRYIHQKEKGNIVLLFVRTAKEDRYRNSMAYTFLGTAQIVSWEGSQPMSIIYRLDQPIPAKYIEKTDSSGVL